MQRTACTRRKFDDSLQHFKPCGKSTASRTQSKANKQYNWQDLIGSNLKAPMFLAQAAAKELKKNHGCIVNITDMHIEHPKKGYVVYSVAKAGLVTLTKSLANELSPEGARECRCPWPSAVA
ncbi:Protein FixR [Nymphon striatum]|nr:Protein FixR [Nymphon striatum]